VNRQHAYELLRAGVNDVFRETLGSALDLGVAALRGLGMRGVQALRAARLLREHDEASVRDLATFEGDEKSYATRARQHMTNLEAVLNRDTVQSEPSGDGAWNSEPRSGAKS
jgi:voltage-gated potassium channel Kch